jgi:glycosyltransferase involved in cell wall biosynthesis
MRLLPKVHKELDSFLQSLNLGRPFAGLHLRIGDLTLRDSDPDAISKGAEGGSDPGEAVDEAATPRMYTHKDAGAPLKAAKMLLESSKSYLEEMRLPTFKSAFVATDGVDVNGIRSHVAKGLGKDASDVILVDRYRRAEGSHTTAFAGDMLAKGKLLIPYQIAVPYLKAQGFTGSGGEVSASPSLLQHRQTLQEQVRVEALEDIWVLAHADALCGSASSHFSVLARLWAVGLNLATSQNRLLPTWLDLKQVASGEYASGFVHGSLNGTHALLHPEARARMLTQRAQEWPMTRVQAQSPSELIQFDPTRAMPLIPSSLMDVLIPMWRAKYESASFCLDFCSMGESCDTTTMVNHGATFESTAYMNPSLATECFRRALFLPGMAGANSAIVSDVGRGNFAAEREINMKKFAFSMRGGVIRGGSGAGARTAPYTDGITATVLADDVERHHCHDGILQCRKPSNASAYAASTHSIRVHIEGWSRMPHSFAVVAKTHILDLLERPGVQLSFSEAPFLQSIDRSSADDWEFDKSWVPPSVPMYPFGTVPDGAVLLRWTYPYNVTRHHSASRTVVFMVTEFGCIGKAARHSIIPWSQVKTTVVTPSFWSLEGLVKGGVPRERIATVPHGVDTNIFTPPKDAAAKRRLRAKLGLPESGLIFLTVGCTKGKGVEQIAEAFAALMEENQEPAVSGTGKIAALVVKGLNELYGTDYFSAHPLTKVGTLHYIGGSLTDTQMAELYQACDVYVSASQGEGFGLPILEAAASGLPVIVPEGGAAEETTSDSFAVYIPAMLKATAPGRLCTVKLKFDTADIQVAMRQVANEDSFRAQARVHGPSHVRTFFSTQRTTDMLLGVLQDKQWSN